MAKSRKEKRLARKQKAEEQVQSLRTSEEARFNQVYEPGLRSLIKNGLTVKACHDIRQRKRGTYTVI